MTLFDDREWRLRYIVVDVGGWIRNKRVLLAPDHLVVTPFTLKAKQIHSTLSKEVIGELAPLSIDEPVSRRYEEAMADHYETQRYWMDNPIWSTAAPVEVPVSPEQQAAHEATLEEIERCHVRSVNEIQDYEVWASNDVSLGEVDQLEVEWEKREITNIIAKAGGLLSSKEERDIAPGQVAEIDWFQRRVKLKWPHIVSETSNLSPATA